MAFFFFFLCFHICHLPMYAYNISISVCIVHLGIIENATSQLTGMIREADSRTHIWWIFCLMGGHWPLPQPSSLDQLTSLNTHHNHVQGSTRANTMSFSCVSVCTIIIKHVTTAQMKENLTWPPVFHFSIWWPQSSIRTHLHLVVPCPIHFPRKHIRRMRKNSINFLKRNVPKQRHHTGT